MAYETFQKYLDSIGSNIEIMVSDEPTKTAVQAAEVHSVPVSNIVKSLLVRVNSEYLLFLVPGDRRLDLEDIKKRFTADTVRMADAGEVKDITGYSIGGVPPFGHRQKLRTFIEEGFNSKEMVVAAAGSGNSVFKIKLEELLKHIS